MLVVALGILPKEKENMNTPSHIETRLVPALRAT